MMDRPFVLGVVTDLGGTASPQPGQRFLRVDRDNLDDVMAALGVAALIDDLNLVLRFDSLEQFHPDSLVERLPAMKRLLAERERRPSVAKTLAQPPVGTESAAVPMTTSGSLLDAVLIQSDGPRRSRMSGESGVRDLVRSVTEPFVDRTDDAAAAARRGTVDAALGAGMQAILGAPRFRAIEAAWRAVQQLVLDVETGPDVEIRLLDAPREAAAALLNDEAGIPGIPRCAAFLAGYTFEATGDDLAILNDLATVTARLSAPLIADAGPSLLGLSSFRDLGDPAVRARLTEAEPVEWHQMRHGALGQRVALCLPRVLLRPPYGYRGEEVTRFDFDEHVQRGDHERFLWGSAAITFGRVLARAFLEEGWNANPAAYAELSGMPLFAGSDAEWVPCAEVLMSDKTIEAVVARDLTVVASYREQDRVRFCGVGMTGGGGWPALSAWRGDA